MFQRKSLKFLTTKVWFSSSLQARNKEFEVSNHKGMVFKLITSKEQILANNANVFNGIGCFPGSPCHIQVDPSVTPKQTSCQPITVHLKESFKKGIDKSFKACEPSNSLDQQICTNRGQG